MKSLERSVFQGTNAPAPSLERQYRPVGATKASGGPLHIAFQGPQSPSFAAASLSAPLASTSWEPRLSHLALDEGHSSRNAGSLPDEDNPTAFPVVPQKTILIYLSN